MEVFLYSILDVIMTPSVKMFCLVSLASCLISQRTVNLLYCLHIQSDIASSLTDFHRKFMLQGDLDNIHKTLVV